jgi:hypothetical protein
MSEKVLGFKATDLVKICNLDELQKLAVPVVSLKWLKEYCKKYKQYNIAAKELMWKEDLLSAAKKEAGEK